MAVAAGVAAQGEVYKVGDNGVRSPVLIKEVKPSYTEGAMRRKVQGTVEMSAIIRQNGKPESIEVTRSLDPELDEQAITALKQWEFKPGTLDGKPVVRQRQRRDDVHATQVGRADRLPRPRRRSDSAYLIGSTPARVAAVLNAARSAERISSSLSVSAFSSFFRSSKIG